MPPAIRWVRISAARHYPSAMTTPHCPRCQGSGWVCENHEDRPSDVVSDGGCSCGGAAVPCVCNPEAEFEFVRVFAEVADTVHSSSMKEVEFFRWMLPPDAWRKKPGPSSYKMSREEAQKRHPGAEPILSTRELRSCPETLAESFMDEAKGGKAGHPPKVE